jgi:hypothetical protein
LEVHEVDGAIANRILLGLIVKTDFLARVAPRWPTTPEVEGLFASKWTNLIGFWCVGYYNKYQKAPQGRIETLFEKWTKTRAGSDKDTQRLVNRYLSSLSREYETYAEDIDTDHLIDEAEEHFNAVLAERLETTIRSRLGRGEVKPVLESIQSFARLDLKSPPGIDVLTDRAAQKRALTESVESLVKYPGAAGEFFGTELARDSFVAFMGRVKGGKSWMLLDLAWRGCRLGLKVAYFQVGDLSTNQIMRRFHKRAAYRPIKSGFSLLPVGLVLSQEEGKPGRFQALVEHDQKIYDQPLSWTAGLKAFSRAARKYKGEIKLSRHATKTVSIADIKAVLEGWDRIGWICDVCVIDYAENLAPINPRESELLQIENTWAYMRQLSELRHCLLVTASQTNKEGFKAWCLTREHFSGNKFKLAHVTAFYGINQTNEETDQRILRINPIVCREEHFVETHCLYCAHYLDAANPIALSALPERNQR